MGDTIAMILAVAGAIAVFTALGLVVERRRRGKLRALARQYRGTFEPGTLLSGAPVPEAAAFDDPADKVTYRNVTRVAADEASYVLAQYSRFEKGTSDELESSSWVVCFVSLARRDLPQVDVRPAAGRSGWVDRFSSPSVRPVPVEVADAVPGFGKAFTVFPMRGAGAPAPAALARMLDATVQAELLASSRLVSGFEVRGSVVRVHGVHGKAAGYPHREVFEVARRLASAWAAMGSW